MAYENSAGLGVHNQFGPRSAGGGEGVYLTDGYKNEYVVELPQSGLDFKFPEGNGVKVSAVDLSYVTGTVTHIDIGATAVYDSTTPVTLPVAIPEGSTGVVVVTGGTAGKVLLGFTNVAGDATH